MTRSHKLNEREHNNANDDPDSHLPKNFGKAGQVDVAPNKTKKDGAGKGNWGRSGDEIEDGDYNLTKPRRRSNSSISGGAVAGAFKTKFETVEPEPVFEEELMSGPDAVDYTHENDGHSLSETISVDSSKSDESVDEKH